MLLKYYLALLFGERMFYYSNLINEENEVPTQLSQLFKSVKAKEGNFSGDLICVEQYANYMYIIMRANIYLELSV